MNIVAILRKTLFILLGICAFNSPHMHAQKALPFEISEEDLRKAEAEIEQFRASLSADERAKFDNDVAELTHALETMSEKELEEFFKELEKQQAEPTKPAVTAPPVARPEPIKPVEEPILPSIKKGETKPLEQLLASIILRIESFLVKITALPDFERKVVSWQESGKITKREKLIDWDDLQHEILVLEQKLHKLSDKDSKTKDFKYLYDLIEDKALIEKLNNLNSALTSYEANIIIDTSNSTQPASKAAKAAIRKVLDTLIKAIYTDKLGDSIDKLIEKYEPTAKKIREYEEKKEKEAIEAGKRPKTGEFKEVGKREQPPVFKETPTTPQEKSSSGYIPTPSTGFGPSAPSISGPSAPTEAPKGPGAGAPTPGAGKPEKEKGGEEKSGTGKAESPKEGKGEVKLEPEALGKGQPKKEEKPVDVNTMYRLVRDIAKQLEAIKAIITGSKTEEGKDKISEKWRSLLQNMQNGSTQIDLALHNQAKQMMEAINKLKDKATKLKEGFARLDSDTKKGIAEELKELYDENKASIEEFSKHFGPIQMAWANDPNSFQNRNIRYLFLGDIESKSLASAEYQAKEPVDLFKLNYNLNDAMNIIKSLGKK